MSDRVWLFLTIAVVAEVMGTMALRMAVRSNRAWYALVAPAYAAAFAMLALVIDGGLPLGVTYGIWAASGVMLIAILDRVLFEERITRLMAVGIGLVASGVLIIEAGVSH